MTKWTPGPWEVREDTECDIGHFDIFCADESCVAEVNNDWADYEIARANWCGEYGDTMRADAHLIASAPELYEALEQIEFLFANNPNIEPEDIGTIVQRDYWPAMQAALAKARGES